MTLQEFVDQTLDEIYRCRTQEQLNEVLRDTQRSLSNPYVSASQVDWIWSQLQQDLKTQKNRPGIAFKEAMAQAALNAVIARALIAIQTLQAKS